ncbi:MAG: BMC domain-containing protein [Bacteroidetes bacterium]|nr:BMC domain-containing protein [Bacteroidota bacterium]
MITYPATSIGLIELSSITAGYQAADVMLKSANVNLMLSRTICSGKYMVLISGEVAAVKTAVENACAEVKFFLIDHFVIPNVDPSVLRGISGQSTATFLDALGICESFNIAALIEAADQAVKSASVDLIELRLAMALGGKAFFSVTGDVSSVKTAVETGAAVLTEKGALVNKLVIAQPRPELMRDMI